MTKDPILAVKRLAPSDGYKITRVFHVIGGLHYLKGNAAPYFSLTYQAHRIGFPGQCWSGGAGHEEILKHFPRFADLAALHLSNLNGEPMHATANGWYYLAGALPRTGERYHAGNSKRNFPLPPDRLDPTKPWVTTEYREPTRDECLQLFADYWRIDLSEAARIKRRATAAGHMRDLSKESVADMMAEEVARLRPTWKAQADTCIAKHGLRVFGDAWEGQAA